jgi:trimeric autotransporter adhesin
MTSWWRVVPAVLVALAAVAVQPTQAGATATVPPTTWNNVTPASGSPAGLSNASMTNDITDGGSLLFGGEDSTGTFQSGTWIWSGTAWTQDSPAASPSARINAALARTQDGTTNGAVLFGGFDGTSYLADTWTWDGTTWTQQTPATSPPARAGATMEYYDGQVVLFGGYNGSTYFNDTWTWNGTTWTQDTGTNPPARAYASMAEDTGYAEGTGALVLFGGYDGTGYLGDTWTYTATGWTQQSPTTSPPARAFAAMAYDGTLAEPTLFGGYNGTTFLGDTWEYTGTNEWVEEAPTASPPPRAYAAMADNSTDGQLVLFGGQTTTSSSSTLGDTWTFYSAPDAPTGVTATAGDSQATVTFNAVPFYGDGGYTITSYTVTSSPDNQVCTVTPTGTPPATYNCTVSGLTNGTSYTFTVTSTNFQGTGLPSTPSNAVVPAAVPGAPTIGTATGGNTQASVAFTTPASDGGSAITSYTVTATDSTTPANGGQTESGSASPLMVTGLTNGDSYTFTVTATNEVGAGPGSSPSNAVVPDTLPGAPTIGAATAGNTEASVAFTAPSSDGGSAITSYKVSAIDSTTPGNGGQTKSGSASPLVVTGLTNGDSYTFTVTATNAVGTGLASSASNAVVPASVPGAPTHVIAVRGNVQAAVAFTPPASDGGSPITSYKVTAIDSTNPAHGGQTVTGSSSPMVISGLTDGDSYTFTVTAANGAGPGLASSPSNAVVPAAMPGPPTKVTATRGNGRATVSFTPPASDGGSAITSYTVTASGGQTAIGSGSPLVVTGLTDGDSYTFTVTATNAVGTGPASSPSRAVVPATTPGAPTAVTVTGGNALASVGFTAPASDGGSPITSYTVGATDLTTPSNGGETITGSSGPMVVTGLTDGDSYTFTVTATNAVGTGPASSPSSPVVPSATGYWLVAKDGGIFAYGDAGFYGSHGGTALNAPIVGMAATPNGQGYWLVASDGGVFAYGNAHFYGSHGGSPLNQPIVGMAATPNGHGYWLVAKDGGIFAYGDAIFYGSHGGSPLNQPIVGMASAPNGQGYWLVASDGGIFAYGDAIFYGSHGGSGLNRPIVGMASAPNGQGYWLVASDGGIFAYGDAEYQGSHGAAPLNAPIVGMAASPNGEGYWLMASDGGIFAYGDAGFYGSHGEVPLNQPIVGGVAASA